MSTFWPPRAYSFMMGAVMEGTTSLDPPPTVPALDSSHAEFEQAFRDLYPRAFALARRLVRDRTVAEDLAAETMARAYARWDRLDPERRPGWVLRVTSNQAIDLMRRKGHTFAPGVIDLEDDTVRRIALAKELRRLPSRQRDTIALRYLGDLTEEQAAACLGISVGSVKTHTHRGLAALRRGLGSSFDPRLEALDD